MPRAARFFIFLSLALLCLIGSGVLLLDQIGRYNAARSVFPPATEIAGIPVGGLDTTTAAERLRAAYTDTPVALQIEDSVVHLDPAAAGQQFDPAQTVERAYTALAGRPYWQGLWSFVLRRGAQQSLSDLEDGLECTVDTAALRDYLAREIAPRYDQPPLPGGPVAAGDVLFFDGQPGVVVDWQSAEPRIAAALCSLADRVVSVTTQPVAARERSVADLDVLLQTIVQASGFDGLAEVYYQDLRSGEEINFAMQSGRPLDPGIAFTAASTIKIPVMVSTFRQVNDTLSADLLRRMEEMIDLSDNASTDAVMETALDPNIAPVQVTQDMQALGLQNTFLAGFFYTGAPLLNVYQTPANIRADVSTDPDVYNQTTPADMGRLLAAIYRCADQGGGPLADAFAGQITQAECQVMTDLLVKNRKGVLVEIGVPEGTRMGHKYGWVTDPVDGLMRNASDAALVYSPGGDFVLVLYFYHPDQLQWDPAQWLAARLTTAVYNFYNN